MTLRTKFENFTIEGGGTRLRHGAGVAGYTHRYIAAEVAAAVDTTCLALPDYVGAKALTVAVNGPTVKALTDGRKYLQFDGTNDTLKSDSITGGDVATVILIARARTTDSATTIVASGSGVSINRNGASGTVINPSTPANNPEKLDNQWRFLAAVATASAASLTVDGTKITATPDPAGVWGTSLRLGANGAPNFFSPIDVLELITYPTALSDADIALVRTAMKAYYADELL